MRLNENAHITVEIDELGSSFQARNAIQNGYFTQFWDPESNVSQYQKDSLEKSGR